MKLSRLFVLSAFGLVSLSVSAADLIERTAPEEPSTVPVFGDALSVEDIVKTPATFETGKIYVLYNVEEEKYFSQGCAWATQASTASLPIAVRFSVPEGKTLADAALLMSDYNLYTNKWNEVFFDSETALFTDRGSQANYFFQVVPQGDNIYRLQASEANPTLNPTAHSGFVGRDVAVTYSGDSNGRTISVTDAQPLSPFLEEGEGHYLDWQFFEVSELSEWEKYFTELEVYNLSKKLMTLIQAAEDAGVDISAAVNVYNNTDATLAQIAAAIEALQTAMASGINQGTAENPADATSLLQNPNFDNASAAGWSGSSPNMVGSGSHGPANVAEFYEGKNVDMYQELAGLPNGVYRMEMFGLYRSGNSDPAYQNFLNGENYRAKLYATADGEMLTTDIVNPFEIQNTKSFEGPTDWGVNAGESNVGGFYIPNDPSCARVYFNQGWYKNTLFFYVSDGTAKVGVREDGTNIAGDWFPFDEFTLTYYGDSEASFGKWVELSAPNFDNAMVTSSLLDSYKSSIASLIAGATDKASAIDAVSKIKELAAPLKANSALWAKWLAALDNAVQYTTGDYGNLPSAGILGEYISFDGEDQKANPTWSDDEIEAQIAYIAEMIEKIEAEAKDALKEGEDVTRFLTNPDFSNGTTGWTIENTGSSVGNTHVSQSCFEAWHNNGFDVYQIVKDVPVGIYEISVQGYVRYHDGQTAVSDWESGNVPENIPVYVYLNSATTQFANVFSNPMESGFFAEHSGSTWLTDSQGYEYPDNMTGAAAVFALEDETKNYTKKAYGLIAQAGDELRIGVKGTPTDCWPIWDNFKLTYRGFSDASIIQPILEETIANIDTSKPMGKSIYAKASTAVENANAALNSGDGKTMFDALSALFELNEEISTSVGIFAELQKALESLEEMFNTATNETAVGEAAEFKEQTEADIKDHIYENEDVPDLLAQIKGYRYMMRMPAEIVAGTDLTDILESPEYSNDEGAATSEGWEGTKAAVNSDVMNAEIFNAAEFDHYQEIPGLPAGQYEVTVKAFYRAGYPTEDYAAFQEGKDSCDNVKLYANNDSVTIHRLAEFADGTHAGEENWAEVAEGSGLYVPNMMGPAATLFDEQEDAMMNTIIGEVGSDGILRLGLVKKIGIANDWCLFDNWTLKYLGEGGDHPGIQGDVNGDGTIDVADISAVISVMAGDAEFAAADVNEDGTVDVADISNIISIMAANARAAQAIEE